MIMNSKDYVDIFSRILKMTKFIRWNNAIIKISKITTVALLFFTVLSGITTIKKAA